LHSFFLTLDVLRSLLPLPVDTAPSLYPGGSGRLSVPLSSCCSFSSVALLPSNRFTCFSWLYVFIKKERSSFFHQRLLLPALPFSFFLSWTCAETPEPGHSFIGRDILAPSLSCTRLDETRGLRYETVSSLRGTSPPSSVTSPSLADI